MCRVEDLNLLVSYAFREPHEWGVSYSSALYLVPAEGSANRRENFAAVSLEENDYQKNPFIFYYFYNGGTPLCLVVKGRIELPRSEIPICDRLFSLPTPCSWHALPIPRAGLHRLISHRQTS